MPGRLRGQGIDLPLPARLTVPAHDPHALQLAPLPPRLPAGRPRPARARGALRPALAPTFLVLLSFLFYASWDARFVPLLAASILLNWLAAEVFGRSRSGALVSVAIALNLLLLGLFKYLDFFAGLFAMLPGVAAPRFDLALPIGISFFTFQHIMYLSDLRAGRAERGSLLNTPSTSPSSLACWPARSCAGPRSCPQLAEPAFARADAAERFARGLCCSRPGSPRRSSLATPSPSS